MEKYIKENRLHEYNTHFYKYITFIYKIVTNVYRKVKFEKSIAECTAYSKTSSELGASYSRIVNLENNKNRQRGDAKYEKQMDERNQIRDGGYWWY